MERRTRWRRKPEGKEEQPREMENDTEKIERHNQQDRFDSEYPRKKLGVQVRSALLVGGASFVVDGEEYRDAQLVKVERVSVHGVFSPRGDISVTWNITGFNISNLHVDFCEYQELPKASHCLDAT
ncbi:hypothetical protein STEG23_008118, partial [Scotinomys teguina]